MGVKWFYVPQYMLAMVFVYLLRAKVAVFCPRDFFLALHIAHDMEDDYYVCVTGHTLLTLPAIAQIRSRGILYMFDRTGWPGRHTGPSLRKSHKL